MLKNKGFFHFKTWFPPLLAAVAFWTSAVRADRSGWQRRQVNWRITGGTRIKAVNYPEDKPLTMLAERDELQSKRPRKEPRYPRTAPLLEPPTQQLIAPIIAIVFDSPPVDGFVPWIAISVTDARSYQWYDTTAYAESSVTGNYLTANPQSDYAIGIFDTGASASLISDDDAFQTGIYDAGLVTSSPVILQGVVGDALAWASQPLGIFIDGIDAIEPNGLLIDDSRMVGETNVSIIVGDAIESPNLPTAIGAPLAVYFSAAFCNNRQLTLTVDSNELTAPYMRFYDQLDPRIPYYSNKIYLELRPTQVSHVQYFPCIEGIFDCPDGDGSPLLPTIIVDGWWIYQGLFFVSSVDLTHAGKSALDKDGFMFDTGAQVTVIAEAIAARLKLNPDNPDFTVEIQGVTGDAIIAPGFYIDSLEITATPQWLSFTNVPVIMLDVKSPEGGYLDGIIGMNLFIDLNFVFKGGGLPGQTAPYIRFDPVCRITADIAPGCGDCTVDFLDLDELANHWLETSPSPNWNPHADLGPQPTPDEKVDFLDYAVLAEHWLEGNQP